MNRGAIALKLKTAKRGEKARLAKALDVGPDVVSHWLSADFRPDTKSRARMEDELRISWRWWDEDLEAGEVEQAERELADTEATAEPSPTFLDPPASTGTDGVR